MLRITQIAKSKGLTAVASTIESVSYQYQQRCFGSSTVKPKKPKPTTAAKRSSVRKGGSATAKSPKNAKTGGRSQDEKLEALCWIAPSPVRYLKPKDKWREEEREKLGLVSEGRRQEIEMLKKQAKQGGDASKHEPAIMGTRGLDYISLGIVDAELIPNYELTVEDGRRLAKEYSRTLMRQHNKEKAHESCRRRLEREAFEALPENLKAAALRPDLTPYPPHHFLLTLTPPIEGYAERIREEAKKNSGFKLR